MKNAGARIRQLREEKDWSQLELAKTAAISNSVLSRIEAGKRPIEDSLLIKFAEIFNVSTDYILGRTDNRMHSAVSPTDAELAEYLRSGRIQFNGDYLDDQDKEDIINFLRMVWKRKGKK